MGWKGLAVAGSWQSALEPQRRKGLASCWEMVVLGRLHRGVDIWTVTLEHGSTKGQISNILGFVGDKVSVAAY